MKLEVVVLPVSDVDRAKEFYGGLGWLVQEITTRLPGRVAGDTTYASVADLAQALKRAAIAPGEHEQRTGGRDENWPDWYAAYMVAEQAGPELPT
jgi:catechol 2,3-dioxygenase-like lactoylglutathione lyase family enzyme